jgi:hypothetical protein
MSLDYLGRYFGDETRAKHRWSLPGRLHPGDQPRSQHARVTNYSHQCELARRTTLATMTGRDDLLTELAKSSTTMRNTPQPSKTSEINVVRFRPRDGTACSEKRALDDSTSHICDLLDLSRYECPDRPRQDLDAKKDTADDFKHRIRTSIMALIFLLALAGLAAAEVLKLEAQISCPTESAPCAPI